MVRVLAPGGILVFQQHDHLLQWTDRLAETGQRSLEIPHLGGRGRRYLQLGRAGREIGDLRGLRRHDRGEDAGKRSGTLRFGQRSGILASGPIRVLSDRRAASMPLTKRQKELWATPEGVRAHLDTQVLDRELQPSEMAGPCLFLASRSASAVTAHVLIADAGVL